MQLLQSSYRKTTIAMQLSQLSNPNAAISTQQSNAGLATQLSQRYNRNTIIAAQL
jgi:hypothetical protein